MNAFAKSFRWFQFVLSIACILSMALPAHASLKPIPKAQIETLSQSDFKVRLLKKKTKQTLVLVGKDGDELIFRLPGKASGQRVYLPLSDFSENTRLVLNLPRAYYEALNDVNHHINIRHMKTLRKLGYPLVRYLDLDLKGSNFETVVLSLFQALMKFDDKEEAILLAEKLDFEKIDPQFLELALDLVAGLMESGNTQRAFSLLDRVEVENLDETQLELLLEFGQELLAAESFEHAYRLFQRVQTAESSYQPYARLWTTYCSIRLGRLAVARVFLDNLDSFEGGTSVYSLKRLIEGRYYFELEAYEQAMRAVADGVAHAKVSEFWMPELLFISARCYEQHEDIDVAQNTYREVTLFFPNTVWGQLSETELARLDKPEEADEESS